MTPLMTLIDWAGCFRSSPSYHPVIGTDRLTTQRTNYTMKRNTETNTLQEDGMTNSFSLNKQVHAIFRLWLE